MFKLQPLKRYKNFCIKLFTLKKIQTLYLPFAEFALFIVLLALINGCTTQNTGLDEESLKEYNKEIQKQNLLANIDTSINNYYLIDKVKQTHNPNELTTPEKNNLYSSCQSIIVNAIGNSCSNRLPKYTLQKKYFKEDYTHIEICNKEDATINVYYKICYGKCYQEYNEFRVIPPNQCEYVAKFSTYDNLNILSHNSESTFICDLPDSNRANLVVQYQILNCMNGFPVYKSVITNMLDESEELKFKVENITGFEVMFPLNYQVPDFKKEVAEFTFKKPNHCGDNVCDYDEDERWCDDCKIHHICTKVHNRDNKCKWDDFCVNGVARPIDEYYKQLKVWEEHLGKLNILKEYGVIVTEDGKTIPYDETQNFNSKRYFTEEEVFLCLNEGFASNNIGSKVRDLVEKETPTEIKTLDKPILQEKTYDFPELELNKNDLYAIFNYNPKFKEVMKNYNNIGLKLESGEGFTLIFVNGELKDVKSGLNDNVDFTIKTDINTLKRLMLTFRNGEYLESTKIALGLLPTKVKLSILPKINSILKA